MENGGKNPDGAERSLAALARAIRLGILELSYRGRTAHVGSCLSVADILAAIYGGGLNITPQNARDEGRDRLVFGKGHAAAALLAALSEAGFFSRETILAEFNQPGRSLQEHPGPNWPVGVETAAGALGHAMPIAVGLAMATEITNQTYRVCAVVGDGEMNEGSNWEAAMFAGGQAARLANLAVIVDANGWQAIGRTSEVTALEPLAAKWEAFGWRAIEADGHDPEKLYQILREFRTGDRPTAIIARTVKGRGVGFMEDDNNWHYRVLKEEEFTRAVTELSCPEKGGTA